MNKYNLIKTVLLIFSGSLFISCSCMRVLSGVIKDSTTHMPITGAKISITNEGHKRDFESDSLGKFEVYLSGGNKCPRIKAEIYKEGFEVAEIKEPRKRDTLNIYLNKLQ